jgi:DNA-binding SARP family transcriptional activator
VEIQLLGEVKASHLGQPVGLGGRRQKCVLAILLLARNQVVPTSRIIEQAWPADPPQTAADLVASYTSRLRRTLSGPDTAVSLTARHPGYVAELDPDLVDVHRFTRLLREADRARAAWDDEIAATRLEQALQLWRGETALSDLDSPWLHAHARTLEEQRLTAAEHLAALALASDRPERAVALLRERAPAHPERDGLTALLVQALSATGEHAQAIEIADRTLDALDQRGLPAGPQLRAARRRAQRPPATAQLPTALRQLPADTRTFTGRDDELAQLLRCAAGTPALVISAIDGMAGIGKSALAIRAAHLLADQYPDGQLFLDLHGYTQGMAQREPADALALLLRTLGLPPAQIPEDLEARAALYRGRLADTKTLIVLDNAATEAQVRPLLPGTGSCLVLITSRKRLKALDDAHTLPVGLLPHNEAAALFRQVAGIGRVEREELAVQRIADLCGRLPLALRIAAALLRADPAWSLARLIERLSDHVPQEPGLAGFTDGDRSLEAVFDLSYLALGDEHRTLFRHLGLVPGPDIDPYAAAALCETHPVRAERLLEDLVNHSLLVQPVARR